MKALPFYEISVPFFIVTPCTSHIKHFYRPTNATPLKKKVELLKLFQIKEAAPACFGLQ